MSKKKKDEKKQDKKRIIDLTSYLSPDIISTDPDGSYTGVPAETYYDDELIQPIQDVDDL